MAFDPRYSTHYQIPYEPLVDVTRLEFERSLFSLEQKLRKRREIDLQMQRHEEKALNIPFQSQTIYLNQMRAYEQKQRLYQTISKQNIARQFSIPQLSRLDQLRMEKDLLDRQAIIKQTSLTNPNFFQQDEELIKKYENGQKAKQYYQDLQNQQLRRRQIQAVQDLAYREQLMIRQREKLIKQKELNYQKQRIFQSQNYKHINRNQLPFHPGKQQAQDQKKVYTNKKQSYKKQSVFQTPYQILKNQKTSSYKNQDIQANPGGVSDKKQIIQGLQKQFDRVEQQKMYSKSYGILPKQQRSKSAMKTPFQPAAQNSPHRQINHNKSATKLSKNNSKYNLSPHKISLINQEYIQQNEQIPLSSKQIGQLAHEKIQNRLKLSKIIYQETQFRNNREQTYRLFSTYENQMKNRKDILKKLNTNPIVLRKHALVID